MRCALVLATLAGSDAARLHSDAAMEEIYQAFRRVHRGAVMANGTADGGVSHAQRRQIFQQRLAAVERQNARQDSSWKAATNKFADYTDAELTRLLGHVHSQETIGGLEPSLLEVGLEDEEPAAEVDWVRETPTASEYLRDQAGCGSCWAVAAVSALEMHAELQNGHAPRLSTEQVIDCTPNPRLCGGEGGCKGATSELALEYIKQTGISLESTYPSIDRDELGTGNPCFEADRPKAAHIDAWTKVPRNDGPSMLRAVATSGPLLVSVAGSDWFSYSSGVFEDCHRDAIINHAVVLVGYGADEELDKDYWKLRNSWGKTWGEAGYLRLLRHGAADEDQYCGVDREPLKGFGCKGGPPEMKVCGMCGVLSHPSHPNTVRFVE